MSKNDWKTESKHQKAGKTTNQKWLLSVKLHSSPAHEEISEVRIAQKATPAECQFTSAECRFCIFVLCDADDDCLVETRPSIALFRLFFIFVSTPIQLAGMHSMSETKPSTCPFSREPRYVGPCHPEPHGELRHAGGQRGRAELLLQNPPNFYTGFRSGEFPGQMPFPQNTGTNNRHHSCVRFEICGATLSYMMTGRDLPGTIFDAITVSCG